MNKVMGFVIVGLVAIAAVYLVNHFEIAGKGKTVADLGRPTNA